MAFKDLPLGELNSREKDKILIRLEPLVQYLGSPGDWGYDTKLGAITVALIELFAQIRSLNTDLQ